MSLEERCREAFGEALRSAGFHDFVEDRIAIVERREGIVEAWAYGGDDALCPVMVDWRRVPEGVLKVLCDCPTFHAEGVCHHLWATFLTLDRELGESLVPGAGPLRLERGSGRAGALPATERPGGGDWHRQLAAVADLQRAAAAVTATGSGKSLAWYRLDLPTSEAAGRLTLDVLTTEGDSSLRPLPPDGLPPSTLAEAEDLWLVELLTAFTTGAGPSQVWLPPVLFDAVLPRLCATGRFGWQPRPAASVGTLQPLAWQGGESWRFALEAEKTPPESADPGGLQLLGLLRRGSQTRSLREPLLLLSTAALVVFPDRLARLDAGQDGPWLTVLRQAGRIWVPAADEAALIRQLTDLPRPPDPWPPNLRPTS